MQCIFTWGLVIFFVLKNCVRRTYSGHKSAISCVWGVWKCTQQQNLCRRSVYRCIRWYTKIKIYRNEKRLDEGEEKLYSVSIGHCAIKPIILPRKEECNFMFYMIRKFYWWLEEETRPLAYVFCYGTLSYKIRLFCDVGILQYFF